MILKKVHLDLYFYIGLLIFILGKVINPFFLDFYIFINIFGLFLLINLFINNSMRFRFSNIGLLVLGYILYLIGNLIFISDISLDSFYLSDLFFLFQILLKQCFLIKTNFKYNFLEIIKSLVSFNSLILVFSVIALNYFDYSLIDLYYFFESLLVLIILVYINIINRNFFQNFREIDLDYFFYGQLLWLVGDISYSESNLLNTYMIGDFTDLFFFVGFYFFIKSFRFYNFQFNLNLAKTYI